MTTRPRSTTSQDLGQFAVREWHRSALLVLAIWILPFIIFAAETTVRRVFFYHDIQYYFIPYHRLVVDTVMAGHLPLWNPYAFSGIPLLGDGQTAMFYPPNWLFFVLPPGAAINYVILMQFSIAGVGMFTFMRAIGIGRSASTMAAITFMFSGYLTTRMVHLSIMSGAALIPFVFWAVDRWRVRPSPGRFAAAAVFVAMQALAGHPQVPIYTAAALLLYMVVHAATEREAGQRMLAAAWAVGAFVLAYGVGYALAAIQLFPWVDFARLSPRAANASFNLVAGQSIITYDWLLLLVPYVYGGVRTGLFHPDQPFLPAAIYVWERAAYVGILPLALAAIALLSVPLGLPTTSGSPGTARPSRRPAILALGVVLLVGLLIAGGRDTFVAQLVYVTPVLGRLRAYSRAIVLLSFAVPALAAVGLQQLIDLSRDGGLPIGLRRRLAWTALALIILFAGVLLVLPPQLAASDSAWRQAAALRLAPDRATGFVPFMLALTSAGLLLWWSRFGVARLPLFTIGLVTIDMVIFAVQFNPTTDPAELQGTPPSVAFLQQDQEPFRTATFITEEKIPPSEARALLAMSWGMVYGIPSVNGFNSLQPRRYTDLLFGAHVEDVSYGFMANNRLLQPDNNILSMLNTRYLLVQPGVNAQPGSDYQEVYADEHVTIYRNQRAYPRAYFVSDVIPEADRERALARVTDPDFDPRTQAVVEGNVEQDLSRVRSGDGNLTADADQIRFQELGPNHLQITTNTDQDRLLVVSEMFVPGWRATVDGEAVPIYRANYVLRGVVVPAGQHVIDMVYRPTSALAGLVVTALTVFVLLLAAVAGYRGWQPSPGRSSWLTLPRQWVRWFYRLATTGDVGRPVLLVCAVILFAAIAYWPNRYFFRSTGDLAIYQRYSQQVLETPRVYPREYPPLTSGIFVIPRLVGDRWYPIGFTGLAALAAAAMVLLVDRLSRQGWRLLLLFFLGSFATLFFRYDVFVVLLTVLAYAACLRKRWAVAQLLLGLGVALKLYPALLMPLVVLWQWRSERRVPVSSMAGGLAAGIVALASMIMLSPEQFAQMIHYHQARPLEIESAGASLAWLLGSTTAEFSFGSWNLISPSSPLIISAMSGATIALLVLCYGAFGLGYVRPAAAWALVLLASVATSKVFSTQYLIWVLPFVVLAAVNNQRRAWPQWLWIVICILTGLIYPAGFTAFEATMVAGETPDGLMAIITLRNMLWLAAGVLAVRIAAKSSSPVA